MPDLQGLDTEVLVDMLAEQTELLTAKIAEKNSVELEQYEYEISLIQAELMSRQQKGSSNISDPDMGFTPGTN